MVLSSIPSIATELHPRDHKNIFSLIMIELIIVCVPPPRRGYWTGHYPHAGLLIKARWRKGLFQQDISQNNCVVVQFVMRGIYESDRTVSGEFADFPEL